MLSSKFAPIILLLLILGLVVTGCSGQPPAAPQAPDGAPAAETPASAQEAAAITVESPLAAPDSPLAIVHSPLPTPAASAEPTSETGSIVGRILIVRPEGEFAVSDIIIGLAEVVRDEQGVAKVSGYEPSRAVRVSTDAYGRFVMNGVKPGTYTLILDVVVRQHQLEDEKTGNTIMVDVQAGEVTDVGTLNYSTLPIPGFG